MDLILLALDNCIEPAEHVGDWAAFHVIGVARSVLRANIIVGDFTMQPAIIDACSSIFEVLVALSMLKQPL